LDLVGDPESAILQLGVLGEILYAAFEQVKVPQELPCLCTLDDNVARLELKVAVGIGIAAAVGRKAEHAVGGDLDVEGDAVAVLLLEREVDAAIVLEATRDALERHAGLGEDHGLASWIELELEPFLVHPVLWDVELELEPVVCPRRAELDALLCLDIRLALCLVEGRLGAWLGCPALDGDVLFFVGARLEKDGGEVVVAELATYKLV
jgi:hypothetical protein